MQNQPLDRRRLVLFGLLSATLTGLVSFSAVAFFFRAEADQTPLYKPLIWELTSNYVMLALLPLVWRLFKRFPFERGRLLKSTGLHLLGLMGFSLLHTSGMVAARKMIYMTFGLGDYSYDAPIYRALMELNKDFFTYATILVVFHAVTWYQNNRRIAEQSAQLQADLRESQLQALRAQLDPHFLFNALNAVSDIMYEDVDRADRLLSSLSRLLRFSLDSRDERTHSLKREMETLNLYLDVMRARFPDRLEISIHIPAELEDFQVPVLVLQPLMENSIKHHPRERGRIMRINLSARDREGRLELSITDNGGGVTYPLEVLLKKGVGLDHTVRRLKTLYGAAAEFQLVSVGEGAQAVLLLPPTTGKGDA